MTRNRLDDEQFNIGVAGILLCTAAPVFQVCRFDPETHLGPAPDVLDLLHDEAGTREFLTVARAPETPGCSAADGIPPDCYVFDVDGEGWYVTRAKGSRTYIEALAGTAERLGARRHAY